MKRLSVLIAALLLTLSLAACGDEAPKAAQTPAPDQSSATTAPRQEADEFTPEQLVLAQEFSEAVDAYNQIVDRLNTYPELLSQEGFVTSLNDLSNAITELDRLFESPEYLTGEAMDALDAAIDVIYSFITEAEAALDELDAAMPESFFTDAFVVPVAIVNNTGYDITGIALAPDNSEDFGDNQISGVISSGETALTDFYFTEDTLVWNILLEAKNENFAFETVIWGLDFTYGSTLILMSTEGGDIYAYVAE